jgi:hypothetical protein
MDKFVLFVHFWPTSLQNTLLKIRQVTRGTFQLDHFDQYGKKLMAMLGDQISLLPY